MKRWIQVWTLPASGSLHPIPLHVRVRTLARRQLCPCLKQAPGGGAWVPRLASHHHGPKAHPPLSNHQVSKSHTVVLCKYVEHYLWFHWERHCQKGALFKNGSSLKELSKWNPQFSLRKHERYSCLFACYKTKGISVISVCRGHFMHGIQNKCLLCFKEKVKSKREVFIYFFISANFCSWSSFGTLSRNTLFWLRVPYLCCLLSCAKKGRWLEHKSHDGLGCEIICKKKKLASSIEWLIRRYLCHNKHICADR